MLSAKVDLQSDRMEVDEESKTLKAHVDRMLSVYHDKKEMYTAAVKSLEGSRKTIISEAEEKAGVLIASAEKVCAEMVATAEKKSTNLIVQATKEVEMLKKTAEHEREGWEAEKASVAGIQTFQPIIKICVGGEKFTTSLTTLNRFPDTMIGAMFSGRHALVLDDEGYHFIDRDGTHFRYILNFLRSPETFHQELTGAALKELKTECEYYGLKSLMFPIVRIAAFAANNSNGQSVRVEQDENGVFNVNDKPVLVCSHCGSAQFAPNYNYYRILRFKSIVADKGGVLVEDQPHIEGACYHCGK